MQEEKRGRPSAYTAELAEKICEIVRTHHHSNAELCRMYDFMPPEKTIYEWLSVHPEFSDLYYRAKKEQCAVRVEQLVEQSNDVDNDVLKDEKGRLYMNNVKVARLREKAKIIQWAAERYDRDRFGSKKLEEENDALKRDLDNIRTHLTLSIVKNKDDI